jgi:hypothetical protein
MKTKREIFSVLRSNVVTAKVSILILVVALVSYIILKILIIPNITVKDLTVSILESILSTAIGVSIISIAWDIAIRRQFLQEVRETLKISENFHKSGILRVRNRFNDVHWDSFYEEAESIELVLFHANDTISKNRHLITMIAEKGIKICVKLPDPNNQELIDIMINSDDNYEKDDLISSIISSINFFIGLKEDIEKSNILVKIVSTPFPFSMYSSEEKMNVLILSKKMKNTSDPIILECSGQGQMAEFVKSNIEDICANDNTKTVKQKFNLSNILGKHT